VLVFNTLHIVLFVCGLSEVLVFNTLHIVLFVCGLSEVLVVYLSVA